MRLKYMRVEEDRLKEASLKVFAMARHKKNLRRKAKNPNDMNEVVVCSCGKKEYNGLMYWRDGFQFCRHCIEAIWRGEGFKGPSFKKYYPDRQEESVMTVVGRGIGKR